jgi:hypothetical protein
VEPAMRQQRHRQANRNTRAIIEASTEGLYDT